MNHNLNKLAERIDGELYFDKLLKNLYAVDASVYRELPLAVAYPKTENDLEQLIKYAHQYQTSLIPRAAGTSLGGQCVGDGIVVDLSKYFTKIVNVNQAHKTVRLQPGVIRDDLNRYLKRYGLFFSPNTSTSNRCMIGGMLGNNSSGTTSIKYGVTRDKVIEMHCILSDGSKAVFGEITKDEFFQKQELNSLEGTIYKQIYKRLSDEAVQNELRSNLPKASIHRRNTGYAVDELLNNEVFSSLPDKFNMCKLLAGSEGTLALTTQATLKLDGLPPQKTAMIAAHFKSIEDCLRAVVPVMQHNLYLCEMMDKTVLDRTKDSIKFRHYRYFIEGDPKGILFLQLRAKTQEGLQEQLGKLQKTLQTETKSYANPVLNGEEEAQKAVDLRKAGLGLLGNIQSDRKAVGCIEDTAVALEDLADYIMEFTEITKAYGQELVYYAHAGAGELHLRPMLNLKKSADVKNFRRITLDIAKLVKKYQGSLSGEHGDGRLRAEFIGEVVGQKNLDLFKKIKSLFDPHNIFNPGKIVNPPPMDEFLRYKPDRQEPEIPTLMDFSDDGGILKAAEKCNGVGACRKSAEAGGTMCPSYRATKNEKDSTRARANALREFLTNSEKPNKFDHEELKEVLDLCISCKGCKTECPSNVDMAVYKAEFTYQYQKVHGASLRSKVLAKNHKFNELGAIFPSLTNFFFTNKVTSGIIKSVLGIAEERSLPTITKKSLRKRLKSGEFNLTPKHKIKSVYLFIDEFTEHLDTEIGADAIQLLVGLGYEVKIVDHEESGRSYISKGFLDEAKELANKNIDTFKTIVSESCPLVGIEPSSILSFRDEYLRLANHRKDAETLAKNVFLIDEFLAEEIKQGNLKSSQFTEAEKVVKIQGHCHQKAITNIKDTFDILNLPKNYKVTLIPSGCCGMAGSFGYEKEHYEVSMKIGEQTLLPAIRKMEDTVIISSNGTSCRHQIKDGAARKAYHPVSILLKALK